MKLTRLFTCIFLISLFCNAQSLDILNVEKFSAENKNNNITRVFGSAPPITLLVYVLAPEKLIGVNTPFNQLSNNKSKDFLSNEYQNLPIVGGWHGENRPNLEKIMYLKPELIIFWDTELLTQKALQDINTMKINALKVNIDSTENYPEVFLYLGEVLGKKKRADELYNYSKKEIDELKKFTSTIEKKARVYYAQGDNGLQTECDKSFHAEAFILAGAEMVYKCEQKSVVGMVNIDFEQVLKLNPEVIITRSKNFYDGIYNDKKWTLIDAVKNKRVFLVPDTPFNWLDRPPSFFRILGAHWLASKFYKETYPYDIDAKIADFFKVFFYKELNKEEIKHYFVDR
ncbi:MAG: ABC transporter substrate-binding protein [Campylobacteraceae bacterium]